MYKFNTLQKRLLSVLVLLASVLLTGCTTAPPSQVSDVCAIFREKKSWYPDALTAQQRWGSPVPVMMAILHQESRFRATAKPPRKKILGFIPGPRPSSAYGYSQAKKTTWREYEKSVGRYGADRDDFGDAIDFVAWYNAQSRTRSGIALHDTYRLYLAYHEGHGGFNRATHNKKPWLLSVAREVESQAARYQTQLRGCAGKLPRKKGLFGWF